MEGLIIENTRRQTGHSDPSVFVVLALLLLVGIAVLLFPVFARPRHVRHVPPPKTRCLRNLRQIGEAFEMYRNDNDGHWPPSDDWCDSLQPYCKNESVFNCPEVKTGFLHSSVPKHQYGGYAYNEQFAGVSEKDVAFPANADVVLAFDAKPGWNVAGGAELIEKRHHGTLNCVFADGHTMSVSDVKTLLWTPSLLPSPDKATESDSGK